MKLSLMVAISKNGVIGNGPDIPWSAKGEQLLFKAITYNQWLLVGRKTFESMGALPNRKYAVVTRSSFTSDNENVVIFPSIKDALTNLKKITDHVIVSGGGEIYKSLIDQVDTLHILSLIHILTELKLPDIKVANNKLLIDVSVSMPAAIALDIILPHMSKSIFTEKLAANFGLAAFPLLN